MTALLALLASIVWGVADFLGGAYSRRVPTVTVMVWSQTAGMVVVGVVLALGGWRTPGPYLWWAVAGGVCGTAAGACFYRALALGTMSIVAPIAGTGLVVPVVAGLALGERPGAVALAGIVLATAGVVLASGPELRGVGVQRRSVLLAIAAATGFGGALALLPRAGADRWAMVTATVTAVGLLMTSTYAALRRAPAAAAPAPERPARPAPEPERPARPAPEPERPAAPALPAQSAPPASPAVPLAAVASVKTAASVPPGPNTRLRRPWWRGPSARGPRLAPVIRSVPVTPEVTAAPDETACPDEAAAVAAPVALAPAVPVATAPGPGPLRWRPRPRDALGVSAIGALNIGALALYSYASTRGLVAIVAVLASLYSVVTVLLAYAVLGERLRGIQLIGVVAAFAGVVCLASG